MFLLLLEYEIDAVTIKTEPKPTNARAILLYGKIKSKPLWYE
jgi:hypothetical protein